jgi:hypothetical protein
MVWSSLPPVQAPNDLPGARRCCRPESNPTVRSRSLPRRHADVIEPFHPAFASRICDAWMALVSCPRRARLAPACDRPRPEPSHAAPCDWRASRRLTRPSATLEASESACVSNRMAPRRRGAGHPGIFERRLRQHRSALCRRSLAEVSRGFAGQLSAQKPERQIVSYPLAVPRRGK